MAEDTKVPAAPRRAGAAAVIERVFRGLDAGLRVRLWDGSEVAVGGPEPAFTIVIRDRDTFRRVFRSARTRAFAEAFVDDRLDVEGDLFAALRLAGTLEGRRVRLRDRLAILRALRRV
jgi:hypothetical protein